MKRFLSSVLVLVLLITPLTNVKGVSAVVYSTAEYDDIIGTSIGAAETYEDNFNNVQEQQGIFTQLYQARQIFSYATALYGVAYSARNDKDYRNAAGGTIGNMALNLSDMIVAYNAAYFVSEGEYLGVRFSQKGKSKIDLDNLETASDNDIKSECEDIESWCIKIANQYIVKTVEVYADSIKDTDNDDNKSLCAEIYKGLKYGLTCISDTESVLGLKGTDSLKLSNYAFKKSTVETRIKDDIDKYADIFSIGQVETIVDDNIENAVHIDATKSVIENMADVYLEKDTSKETYGTISVNEDPKLTLAYLSILASSSTYTPFESYVGDSRFMKALESLCPDQETATLLRSYYNSLKLYKKPLYYRSLNSVGNPEGQAELKSIEEIFELIKSGAAGALCTANGNLCVNTSTGDWVYTTEKLDSSIAYALKSSMQNTEQVEASLDDYGENADDDSDVEFSPDETAKAIYKALSAKGMSDIAICGILGNIHQECQMDCSAVSKSGTHFGLCQWGEHFPEVFNNWDAYKNDLNKQIEYLIHTLYDSDGGHASVEKSLAGAATVQDACDIFCRDYEGCTTDDPGPSDYKLGKSYYQNVKERREHAEEYYASLNELKGSDVASNKSLLSNIVSGLFGVKTAFATPVTDTATNGTENGTENGAENGTGTGETGTTETGTTETPSFDNSDESYVIDNSVKDSADTVITDYSDKPQDFKDAISAARVISDESRLNGPALLFGGTAQRDVDNMTTAIYSNVLADARNYNINNMDSEYLYMNAFGDIVTASDLVIFPGVLNPLLYNDGVAYNPYSVAFMNSYPANIRNSAYYMLSSKSDVGKYCLFLDTPSDNEEAAIYGYNNDEDDSYTLVDGDYEFALLNSTTGVKSTQTLLSKPMYGRFIHGNFERDTTFHLQKYLFCHNIDRKSDLSTYIPLIENVGIYADGSAVFPYDYTMDTDGEISAVIANNMYQYLTTNFTTKEIGNTGKLHDNWILHYILISGFEGTADISSYKNNLDITYDSYADSSTSRVLAQIVSFSEKLISSISSVSGVLGLKNSYEDPLLGKIVTVIRDYWLVFYIVFLFVVLIAIMRAKKDLLQSAFLIIACSAAAYAFVYFVPVYLPMFYNVAVNNLSDRVSYDILLQNSEYNAGTADNIVDVDDDGALKYNTGSITLYRMPSAQLEQYYENLGISLRDATGGKSFVIDQYSGFFLEGDSLKTSTDVLFGTLSIKDDKSTGGLHAYKTVSNNIDYYIPYYQIVDNLVDNFNRVVRVYDVTKSTTKLRNGARSNNYRAYTYFNSPIFVNPKNLDVDLDMDVTGWSDAEVSEYYKKQQKITTALKQEFGDNEDWLGMYDLLVTDVLKKGSNLQNTLWFQTMCDVGYYKSTADGWVADEDNINALITYVNYQTRNFVYEIRNYIGDVSDESIIKIVALRAVIAMTQEASDFTHWMYPFSVNYPEFNLGDVEVSTFVENYSDYAKNDYSIVKYIDSKYGWFNLIIFDLMSIILFLVTWIVQILSAAFYVLLLLVLLIRMFGDGKYANVVKGFLKCSGVIMTVLLLQVSAIAIGSKLVGNVASIYATLGLSVLSVYLLVIVITSILFNFTEFGNSALNAKVSGIKNSIKSLRSINVNTTGIRRLSHEHNPAIVLPNERLTKYDFDADIDKQYEDQVPATQERAVVHAEDEISFDEDDSNFEEHDYEF